MKNHNVPLWPQSVSCLVVRILRQFERQAAWKQDEPERTQREIQDKQTEMKTDKRLHKVDFRAANGSFGWFLVFSYELNLFQTSVGVAGQACEYTRSQTANSSGTPSGTSHHKEAEVQQPAHGN